MIPSRTSQIAGVIGRFADGGPILVQAASGLTPEAASARPGPGAWSPAEVIAHIVDTDLVLADRMKRLIAEDSPTLQAFDENAWIERLGSNEMPPEEAATLLAANRTWMTRVLRRLDEADFARAGTHTVAGRVTLAEALAKAVNHMDHHLKFLYAKRAKLGLAIYPRYAGNPGF
ncbi:DinB family protein [Tundrisphaera sp. TA3]|uniref:DinB family protein n=1 Tax=Tundrisphaera sp. TA3 TaxID=3435775 RepID=UPI003EB92903